MDSSMLLIILCVVAVCVVAFVLFSRSGKNKASASKEDAVPSDKYAKAAQDILQAVGGKENVVSASYCATRLRFEVKKYALVDEAAAKLAGASGIIRPGKNACQVIIGKNVKAIYDELNKLLQ